MWLPPGGHIDPNEDPVSAVIREVREETGLQVELLPQRPPVRGFGRPVQIAPPVTILLEDIDEPGRPHQHIDMIYFTRVMVPSQPSVDAEAWRWATLRELEAARLDGAAAPAIAEDVRKLGLLAIARFAEATVAG